MSTKADGNGLPAQSIVKSIENIVQNEGFVKYDYKVTSATNPGDNYIGVLHRIKVKGSLKDEKESELHLICKTLPPSQDARLQNNLEQQVAKEIRLYKEVIPEFVKLQEEKGIIEDIYEAFPKIYDASIDKLEEFIILQDLKWDGYVMFDRFLSIDYEHAKLVMIALGKFHSFSFALRDQKPEVLKTFSDIEDSHMAKDLPEQTLQYFHVLHRKALDSLDEDEVELKETYSKFKDEFGRITKLVTGPPAEPYAVVNHGDCWNNNIMFKYQDSKPIQLKLLDYQLSRYASPVLDVVYYIFCCTEKSLRDNHYKDLLNDYYESFSQFLRRLGSDPDDLFSNSVFEEHLMKFGKYGLIMSTITMNYFLAQGDDIPDLDKIRGGEINASRATDIYKRRMSDVIRDMVGLGYI